MKRLFIILSAAALTAGAGCSNNESGAPADGYGRLSIDCSASDDITAGIQAAAPAGSYAPTRAGIPAGEEFALRITGTDYDRSWETLATFPSEEELFVKGSYTAAVTWGNPAEEGFGKYSYAGEREFTIQPRQTTEVHITASIVNSQVLVRTTEQFRRYFGRRSALRGSRHVARRQRLGPSPERNGNGPGQRGDLPRAAARRHHAPHAPHLRIRCGRRRQRHA